MVNNPVLRTLIYENIFKFPLRKDEIWKFLISDKIISKKEFDVFLKDPRVIFDQNTGLYGLSKNKDFYGDRIHRFEKSKSKEKIADFSIKLLSILPTVKLIGISGSLAQFSSKENDDIDLFLIVKKNTVWTSRFFCVLILKLVNLYREDNKYTNKICLNMISDNFSLPKDRHDLYNAIEIAQLRPKFSRDRSYEKFINSNKWTKSFLPNFKSELFKNSHDIHFIVSLIFNILNLIFFEEISKILQMIYMKKRTRETVEDHLLAFHPRDFRSEIMKVYNDRIGTTRGH